MDIAIEVAGLTVRRGKRTVLYDFATAMERGQITGLLGPSGAGKTTLIRAVVGVQKVAAGTVTVLGLPAGSAPCATGSGISPKLPASTPT